MCFVFIAFYPWTSLLTSAVVATSTELVLAAISLLAKLDVARNQLGLIAFHIKVAIHLMASLTSINQHRMAVICLTKGHIK